MFAEFDFSAAKRGPQASTFTELFADVLHPIPGSGLARPEVGADLHASLTVSFADAVHGVERQVLVTRQVVCGACGGAGQVAIAEAQCRPVPGRRSGPVGPRPHGVRQAVRGVRRRRAADARTLRGLCGTGPRRPRRSGQRHGPAGITDGGRLRVMEMGHAGRHGGRAGDLYVTVHVQPHPWLRREGDDLVCELPVAVHEAALGARVDVPSLEGPVKLRIPPGTQAGQRLRVTGGGLVTATGGRGDLLFEVTLVLPRRLDERSVELMREFADATFQHGRCQKRAGSASWTPDRLPGSRCPRKPAPKPIT